ncbi:ABC transporter permease [Desulfomicrobium sp. ZS1]|uniref:ABC transporter permease n=1 Tax=Desulfomicrobium sp. ZS1 TaxID=2952228 RepID=UPI0020B1F79C|nr:ABC transporter permease [Desulfomicrobium sp. ZS1]UTF51206.1 ABC transporter permease [Desulfomicrobium sp. ZS1]
MAVASATTTQGRVIWALILREVHTLYGTTKLGYLWALLQTAFGLGVFWTIREFAGFRPPHGMTVPIFLLAGFMVWNIFSDTINKCLSAVDGNKAILTFPQVTPLDLMVSRTMVITATQIVVTILLAGIAVMAGYEIQIGDWPSVLAILLLAPLWAFGAGTLIASLAVLWPALEMLVPIMLRILFFMSGVFFSAKVFSKKIGDFLLWNPILQLIEWFRQALSSSYVAPDLNIPYLVGITSCTLCAGLLLERYVRRRAET